MIIICILISMINLFVTFWWVHSGRMEVLLQCYIVGVLQFGLLNGSREDSNSWDIESKGEGQYNYVRI